MATYRIRETFFRPADTFACERSALPADIYNGFKLLVARAAGPSGSGPDHAFLPIRSMQYQAVADRDEIVFVDGNGGYAHQDGVGGRLIRIAWRPAAEGPRSSLAAPVPCDILYYFPGLAETQRRLVGETRAALQLALGRQRELHLPDRERRVVAFRKSQ